MAWGDIPPGDLPCYTFNGPYRECADARIARQIATTCGQSHQVIHMGDDFFDDFADLAAKSVYLSDGTMDVTGAAELYVNRDARKIAPVRLTGNYGSEILREFVSFRARSQTVPGIDPSLCSLIPQAPRPMPLAGGTCCRSSHSNKCPASLRSIVHRAVTADRAVTLSRQ